ncbi:hypothetical protein Ciccas_005438 [Cichlidogyrus casuarinus]|uniref:Uncharacterized protein n=1 Tax=Cichlidogyrus casuarinus TaxID=1844966 RepID=A0ABD2Q8P8_9PLAT
MTRLHILRFIRIILEYSSANQALAAEVARAGHSTNLDTSAIIKSRVSELSLNQKYLDPSSPVGGASFAIGSKLLLNKLHQMQLLPMLFELCFLYKWHTFLHATLDSYIKFFFRQLPLANSQKSYSFSQFSSRPSSPPSTRPSSANTPVTISSTRSSIKMDTFEAYSSNVFLGIVQELFGQNNILEKVLITWRASLDSNAHLTSVTPRANTGLLGHLRIISNLLYQLVCELNVDMVKKDFSCELDFLCNRLEQVMETDKNTSSPSMDEVMTKVQADVRQFVLSGLREDSLREWIEFCRCRLYQINADCKVDYTSVWNLFQSSELDDSQEPEMGQDPYRADAIVNQAPISSQVQKLYSEYCQQSMTTPFPESFGYAEDEFNALCVRPDWVIENHLRWLELKSVIHDVGLVSQVFG